MKPGTLCKLVSSTPYVFIGKVSTSSQCLGNTRTEITGTLCIIIRESNATFTPAFVILTAEGLGWVFTRECEKILDSNLAS